MNVGRWLAWLLLAVAVAACTTLPARPAGGPVADLSEDTLAIAHDRLSPEFDYTKQARGGVRARLARYRRALLRPGVERQGLGGTAFDLSAARNRSGHRRRVVSDVEGAGARTRRLAHARRDAARKRGSSAVRFSLERRGALGRGRSAGGGRCRRGFPGGAGRRAPRRRRVVDRPAPLRPRVPRRCAQPAGERRGHHVAGSRARAPERKHALCTVARSPPHLAAAARRAASRATAAACAFRRRNRRCACIPGTSGAAAGRDSRAVSTPASRSSS
jgi:hypothetical protein